MSKSEQIEQLKKDRSMQLYELHRPVIDGIIESLSDDTDRLFNLAEQYLEEFQKLINSYSVIAGSLKDDYILFHAEQMTDLMNMVTLLHNRSKLKAFELHRYTQLAHKSLREVLEE